MVNVRIIKQIEGEHIDYLLEGINKLNGHFLTYEGATWLPGYKCRGCWELPAALAIEMNRRGMKMIENVLHPSM